MRQGYLDQVVWDHLVALLCEPDLIRQELDRRLEQLRATNPATAQKSRLQLSLTRTTKAMK